MDGTLQDKNKLVGTLSSGGSMTGGMAAVLGKDGVGIEDCIFNADYTMTLVFTDGRRYTSPSLKGEPGTGGGSGGGSGQDGITPHIGTNGNWYIGTIDTGVKAAGEKGADGTDGKDGFSPVITVTKSGKVTTITIKDASGTKVSTINDGADGSDGEDGADGSSGKDGRGIVSIKRTSGTGAAGTTDTYTITYTDNTTSTFNVYNGANGSGGSGSGESGATFTPSVDADGNLSWTNNKGLANPATVNIKGAKGNDGAAGVGISEVVQTTTSTADGGTNVITVTKTDGTQSTFNVKNGSKGSTGENGADGITPHIGSNGNWWIGNTDTGVSAEGKTAEAAVSSFHGRTGAVTPQAGDYTADMVGAAPSGHTHSEYAPAYTYGTEDLTAGTSALAEGTLYFVYE